MKKVFVLLIIGLFLIGIVTSATLGVLKNVTIDEETETTINEINNETIMRGNITCGERQCSQRMWKGKYQLGEVSVDKWLCKEYENVTDEINQTKEVCIKEVLIKEDKIIEEITKQQEKRLEEIAKVIRKRNEKENDTIIADSGGVVLK